MKLKQVIISLIMVAGAGAAIFAILRSRSAAPEQAEKAPPPPIVSVQVGALKCMTLRNYVTGYGTVGPAPAMANQPAAAAPLAASVAGVVTHVNVVEGQHVERGDVVVELNSGGVTFAYAQAEAARQKELYEQHNTSLRNLQNAEAQLALLRVTAPLSGTVVHLNVKPGAAVDLTTVVAEVMDLNRLVVETSIPASQAGELKPGQELQLPGPPAVSATLSYVSPAVDTNNGTVLAWAALPAGCGLRPGEFVPLRIVTAVHTDCLAAPEDSVLTDIHGRSTIALVKGDEATQTPVQTGPRENGWVEVSGAGLKAGDSVVTVGAYGLPEKTKIRVVNP